jgi:hypothetical protein
MRRRWLKWLGTILLVVSSFVVRGSAQAQEDPADVATARELFREGLALSKEGKWEEARMKLGQSLALKKAALTYYTLAVADKNSGHRVASLEHFRAFLAQPVTDKTEAFLEPAREAVAELEKQVSRVVIEVAPAGLTGLIVSIDGDPLPLSALGTPRLVEPGEHVIAASAADHHPKTFEVIAKPGKQHDLRLTLQPKPAGDDQRKEPEEPATPTLPFLLLGGGAVVAGVGLTLGILGASEADDAPTRDGEEADAALLKTIVGDVMMGVGGAVGVTGIVLVILHYTLDDEEAPAATSVRPWASGDVLGVQVRF